MNIRAAVRSFLDTLNGRYVQRTKFDARRLTLTSVSQEYIASALSQCQGGVQRALADIYDMLPATDPHILGVRRQLRAGVQGLDMEPVAISEDPLAILAAEECKKAMERPGAAWSALINGVLEGYLRAASLTEVMWDDPRPGVVRYWNGFNLVPQQRLIYNRESGDLELIVNPELPAVGTPVSAFPPGKFVRFQVDTDIPDFSLRGTYRAVLSDWFGRLNVGRWEQQAIERYGMPIPVGRYATEKGREALVAAMESFGAAGMLIVDDESSVDWGASTTKDLIHETYMEKSAERISVAFLGSTQTVTIAADAGSKASAGEHQGIRRDVLFSIIDMAGEVIRRDLFVPFLRANEAMFGAGIEHFAPRLTAQFDEPIDLLTSAQAWAVLKNEMGYVAPLDYVNEITGITFEEGTPTPKPAAIPFGPPRAVAPTDKPAPAGLLAPTGPVQEGPNVDVQTLALNGAQVTALQTIVQSVADGTVPAESAIVILQVAFPTIAPDVARAIINPVVPRSEPAPIQQPRAFPAAASASAKKEKLALPATPPAFGREITEPLKRIVDSSSLEAMAEKVKRAPAPQTDRSVDLLAAEMLGAHMKALTETRNARGTG